MYNRQCKNPANYLIQRRNLSQIHRSAIQFVAPQKSERHTGGCEEHMIAQTFGVTAVMSINGYYDNCPYTGGFLLLSFRKFQLSIFHMVNFRQYITDSCCNRTVIVKHDFIQTFQFVLHLRLLNQCK